MRKASEQLRIGYDRLLVEGWGQRTGRTKPCMADALGRDALDARVYLRQAIGTFAIPTWNDRPWRTFDEVLDAFQRAIKLAEQDEAAS